MRRRAHALLAFFQRPAVLMAISIVVLAGLYLFERAAAHMPFIAFVVLTISCIVFLISRKLCFAAYFGMATVSILTIGSAVKYRLKGFDLHVFDLAFTGEDTAALSFLASEYSGLIILVAIIAVLAATFVAMVGMTEQRSEIRLNRAAAALAACLSGLYATYPLRDDQPRYFHYLGGFNASAFFVSLLDLRYAFDRSQFADLVESVPPQPPFEDVLFCGKPENRPDIFLVLSESGMDPSIFPQLMSEHAFGDELASQDGKVHQLRVETFGGGTWITSLSVMTGLSSLDFGVQAPYLTTVMEGKIHGALPELLARCGYRTVHISPMRYEFVNEGPFLKSVGFQTVLDYDAIGASQYAHRDQFYFHAAESVIREHRRNDTRPLLLSLQTMFPHSPYDQPLVEELGLPHQSFDASPEIDEYLNRVLSSQHDFKEFLREVSLLTTRRGSVVLEFGDHQSFVTKPLADEVYGGNALPDLGSPAYRTYYSVHSVGYEMDMSAFPDGEVDVGFLGAALIKAARLPRSPMYQDMISLYERCQGRYHTCIERAAVDAHLRRRVDSGLLDVH